MEDVRSEGEEDEEDEVVGANGIGNGKEVLGNGSAVHENGNGNGTIKANGMNGGGGRRHGERKKQI